MATPNPSSRWLSGPFPDLLLGCGLIYGIVFVGLCVAGPQIRSVVPLELTPLVLLVTGIPHYGATLLRVYQRAEDRRRYALFGGWATLLVWALFVVGLHEFVVGSLLLTVYLTWSPWHYSAQNYGIAVMFLRRRGVPLGGWAQRAFKASFTLSFVLTFLAFHGEGRAAVYAPGEYDMSVYDLMPIGIPIGWIGVLMPLCAGAYLACLLFSVICLLRVASWRDLIPSVLLAASQALWFTVPVVARYADVLGDVEPLGVEQASYAFLWIAVAHATQYVWITHYYARRAENAPARKTYLVQTLLAGAAIWVVPAVVCAPGLLGSVPFDAGLGVLVAATVNIHHFILDGAIWKLRDGRIAAILLRGQTDTEGLASPGRRAVFGGKAVWLAGAGSVAILVFSTTERVFGLAEPTFRASQAFNEGDDAKAGEELRRIEAAQRRLKLMGRDSARAHVMVAMMYLRLGRPEEARRHAEVAAGMRSDWVTQANLATYYQQTKQLAEAVRWATAAMEQRPDVARLASNLAWLLVQPGVSSPANIARAIGFAERSVQRATTPRFLYILAMTYEAAGRRGEAWQAAKAAEKQARGERDPEVEHYRRYRESLEND